MRVRSICMLAGLLLFVSGAAAQTIYKYRGADGKTTYSNRLIPGAELIEAFEYRFPAPVAAPEGNAARAEAAAAAEARIQQRLAELDAAWGEVQEATRALAAAEARLSAGVGPLEGEGTALGGSVTQTAPDVGGPQAPAAPSVGGPQPPAARAVGGPMGTRRGGGRNPEYADRLAALEAEVRAARARLDTALRNYNQLR